MIGSRDMEAARYEIKMTYDERYLPEVRSWIRLHPDLFSKAYPSRQVNSLYFDTLEAGCLNDHLDGIGQRSKLRLRWYGEDYAAVQGVLELKSRASQVGWKEFGSVSGIIDLTTASWADLMHHLREHAAGIVAVWLSSMERPTLLTSFVREYFESADLLIRVTVDHAIVVYEQFTHSAPNLRFRAPTSGQVVVEVKSDARLHSRVSKMISSFPLQVTRNSKYVNGMLESLGYVNRAIR